MYKFEESAMKRFIVSLSFVVVAMMVFLPFFAARAPSPNPVQLQPSLYWGVYLDGVPWDMNKLETFETALDKKVSIVHWGQPWWHCYSKCGYQDFNAQVKQYDAVRLHGAIPLIDWASWDYSVSPIEQQPQFTLRSIINGDHDAFIREWATQARDWGHPFFLRFDWEMNGNWYPWSEILNNNQTGEFVTAWRHVHDIFTDVGATNVTWVWCVSAEYIDSLPLQSLYPGDAYVDWVGMDGFNWGQARGAPWQSFRTILEPTYQMLSTLAPSKPIMIGEVSSTENDPAAGAGQSKAAWIKDALTQTLPNNFPKVKALVWFDWYQPSEGYHWEIDSSKESLAAFKESIDSAYYVASVSRELPKQAIDPIALPPVLGQ
jgi:mannan endo-1,4-beta-mannosidase